MLEVILKLLRYGARSPCLDSVCGSACTNLDSSAQHHKNGYRSFYIADDYELDLADTQILFLGHILCKFSGTHSTGLLGLGNIGAPYAMVRALNYEELLVVRRIQHELSHNYGCTDSGCTTGQRCIMSGGWDSEYTYNIPNIWCDAHKNMFNRDSI